LFIAGGRQRRLAALQATGDQLLDAAGQVAAAALCRKSCRRSAQQAHGGTQLDDFGFHVSPLNGLDEERNGRHKR
jgi:hypothetical protein